MVTPPLFIAMSSSSIFIGLITGAIGMGYFVYGRNQQNGIALLAGIMLFVIPYAIPHILGAVIASLFAIFLPFMIKI